MFTPLFMFLLLILVFNHEIVLSLSKSVIQNHEYISYLIDQLCTSEECGYVCDIYVLRCTVFQVEQERAFDAARGNQVAQVLEGFVKRKVMPSLFAYVHLMTVFAYHFSQYDSIHIYRDIHLWQVIQLWKKLLDHCTFCEKLMSIFNAHCLW